MEIAFIVCHNGYGHLKRVVSVVNELLKSSCQVYLLIHPEHTKLIGYFGLFVDSNKLKIVVEGMRHSPDWLNKKYNKIQYSQWLDFLETNEVLAKSEIIISDNHVSPLFVYPFKTLLMGSFLWYDVITAKDQEISILLENEQKVFKALRPKVLCLRDFVMNEIEKHGQAIKFGFFTEESETKKRASSGPIQLLVTGGGTGRINDYLIKLLVQLDQNERWKIFVDNNLNKRSKGKFPVFDYTDSSFNQLDAIVSRPGIGILTDAAKHHLKIVLISEDNNKELKHNSEIVVEKKLGMKLNMRTPVCSVAKSIFSYIKSNKSQPYPSNTLKFNGHVDAANYILKLRK